MYISPARNGPRQDVQSLQLLSARRRGVWISHHVLRVVYIYGLRSA